MTVSYKARSGFRGFLHLMIQWKGSIFKLVLPQLIVFIALYFLCGAIYRFALDDEGQRKFEKIVFYCNKYGTVIPVSFVLGFYVAFVVGRWLAQYRAIPWIDTMAMWVNVAIRGEDEEERMIRRTICRYVCLSITQCFSLISPRVKKRFPTSDHLIAAGLLLESEKIPLEDIVTDIREYQAHWIPLVWATALVSDAKAEGRIKSDTYVKATVDEIHKIKDQCNELLCFDRIQVPLVYTQVVTLAVYSYFLSCIMGRQWIKSQPQEETSIEGVDLIVLGFTVLQFLFYMGWLKVAEYLVDPFGDDEYDFELNWMVDRHLQVSYSIVDKMQCNKPKLQKDPFWDVVVPRGLSTVIPNERCESEPLMSKDINVEM